MCYPALSPLTALHFTCRHSGTELTCSVLLRLLNNNTVSRTVASSNTGVIQSSVFEPDIDSREDEEELLVQGRLHVGVREW